MLQNEYLLASIGLDMAENVHLKNWGFLKFQPQHLNPSKKFTVFFMDRDLVEMRRSETIRELFQQLFVSESEMKA